MEYNSFSYLYPPRPEYKILPDDLNLYEGKGWAAQPKYNGDCLIVFTNGIESYVYNRRKEVYSKQTNIDFTQLHYGEIPPTKLNTWFVYVGEFINPKKKIGEHGIIEPPKFVIFDILVYAGLYLVGETFWTRLALLEEIFPTNRMQVTSDGSIVSYKHLSFTNLEGIYRAPTYLGNFVNLYEEVSKVDLYEGLVMKKTDAKLLPGYSEKNNDLWQFKCRKSTKIYNF